MEDETPLERVQRLLDERGVEWWEEDGHTLWYGESLHHAASAFSSFMFGENERVHLNAMVTPEQAVAATLGPGTCEVECFDDGVDEGMDGEWYEYAPQTWYLSCGHEVYGSERPCYCSTCGRKVVG